MRNYDASNVCFVVRTRTPTDVKEWLRHKRPQDLNKKSDLRKGMRYLRKMRSGMKRKSKHNPALRWLSSEMAHRKSVGAMSWYTLFGQARSFP